MCIENETGILKIMWKRDTWLSFRMEKTKIPSDMMKQAC